MSPSHHGKSAPRRRRYLVHLICALDPEGGACRYVSQISPWTSRNKHIAATGERIFADDSELIATINPLLPSGSDVRDVFGHIETQKGFYYVLRLDLHEARRLGWSAATR